MSDWKRVVHCWSCVWGEFRNRYSVWSWVAVMQASAPEPRTQLYSSPVGLAATSSKLLPSEAAYGPLTEQLLGKKPPKGSLEG